MHIIILYNLVIIFILIINFFTYSKLKKLLLSDFIYKYNLTENNIFIANLNSNKIDKIFSHSNHLLRNLFHRDQITLPLSFEKHDTYSNILLSLLVWENNLLLQYKHRKYHHKNSIFSSLLGKLNKIIYNSLNLLGWYCFQLIIH